MKNDKEPKQGGIVPPRAPRSRPGKSGGVRQRNRHERTVGLCRAAIGLFMKQGIDGTSIGQIAQRAGVGKASFYSYFRDKEELVATAFAPFREHILGAMDRSLEHIETARDFAEFSAAQRVMAAELFAGLDDYLDLLRLLLQEAHAPDSGARRPIRRLYEDIVERAVIHNETAQRRGLIRAMNPRVMAYINLGALERLGTGFLQGADLGDPRAAIQLLAEIMLAGLERHD